LAVWGAAWLPFLVALLILSVPGILLAFTAGLRSMANIALAPVLSIAVLSVAAIAAPFLGLSWGLLPAALATIMAAGLTYLIRVLLAKQRGWQAADLRWGYAMSGATIVCLLAGSGVILYRLARVFGSPEFVSQTADNVFHLNAVRFIVETGSASSLTVGGAGGSAPSFYPAAWHGIAALIADTSGATIPVAVACLNLLIGVLVWPLSMWFFCRTILGASPAMNVGFGVLISSFSAFPYLLVDWGVLYPNYLGIAALPAVIGIVVLVSRNGRLASREGIMLPWLGLVGLAGVSLSHPNSVISLIVIVVPYLISRATRRSLVVSVLRGTMPRRLSKVAASLVMTACIVVAWVVLRPFPITSFNVTWPPYQSSAQALGEAFFTTHSGRGAAWATAGLLIAGFVLALTHRGYRWLAASFLTWTLLMVAVTAWQPSWERAFLTGGWFDDYKRIAAGLVLVTLPLALLGFIGICNLTAKLVVGLPKSRRAFGLAASIAVVAVPVFAIAHTGAVREASVAAKSNYNLGPGSPIMSADEFSLYEELPGLVPSDAVIAGNPWDGSAWAYLVSGRRVLYPHVLAAMDKDESLIAKELNRAASNPDVCAAAKRLHVEYVINSDELIYLPGNPNNLDYPGLAGLDRAPGFELVAAVGANRLYKVPAC
jgi:hypothetical protein